MVKTHFSSPIVLTFQELGVFRREVDCLMNFLISENVDIMRDFGGVIGQCFGPKLVHDMHLSPPFLTVAV